jgi:murein DD-endopeptidase MepM/ murein hydrolase activator NlpD
MWFYRHKKKNHVKAKRCTILMIPEEISGKCRNLRVPVWMFKAGALMILILVGSMSFLILDYVKLLSLRSLNTTLMTVNRDQAYEIGQLKLMAADLQAKMLTVQALDDAVRERISLISDDKEQTEDRLTLSSRSTPAFFPKGIAWDTAETSEIEDQSNTLEDLKQELDDMNQLMTNQVESLNQLKSDVEKEIAYEAALPNRWPMAGTVTSTFGYRDNPTGSGIKFHEGLDIANSTGSAITAAGDGVITYVGYRSGWGNMVLISHGFGYVSQYAHCQKTLVKVGEHVKKGQKIATCGATGNTTGAHLHFGVAKDGSWVDPLSVLK